MATVSDKTINDEKVSRDYAVPPKEPRHTFYSEELNVRQMFGVLQRRKPVVLGTIVIITALAIAWSFLVTPKYTAETKVILDKKEQNALHLTNPASSQGSKDDTMISTEVERITSRSLAQTVVQKLQLEDDPEFNETLVTPSWVERLFLRVRQKLMPVIQPGTQAEPNTVGEHDRIIDEFIRHISVNPIGNSLSILIGFKSRSPEKAAAIANMVGNEYLFATLRKRSDNAGRARAWLAEQLQDLRQNVKNSETAVENYRKQHGLFQGESVPLLTQQMSDMDKRRLDAESARRAAEANLAQAQRLLRSPDKLGTAGQVLQSDLVQKLRSDEAALSSREAAFAQQYGPQHPAMVQIREEREKVAAEIDKEINRIIARLQNELGVATRQEVSMASDIDALKKQIEEANEASVGLRSLEREAEADRSLLEKTLASYMETSAQTMSAQLPDVSIVSTAAIPERPSFPRRGLVIAAAAALSGMVGVLLAFSIERVDASFRSAEQVERETGLTVLAHVPAVKTTEADCLSSLTLEKPYSAFAEAIRSIFTRLLMLRRSMRPPRTVLVTSAEPEEGKSTIAMSLAKLLAGTGQRVLILDLDFFQSSPAFSTESPSAGLIQVLEGKADIGDVIYKVSDSGAFAVLSGGALWKYGVLLDTDRLSGLLRRLESDYDVILLDSPPLFVAAVTQRVATLVDCTVFVVHWGHTRREVVSYAVKQLRDCGVNIGGVVLSMVDTRVNSLYYRGDSAYYSGKAKHSKGMSILLPHLAAHKGTADYVPAAPSRTEGDGRNRPRFRLATAAGVVLLAAGAAVAIWQVQYREMMPGGGEANRLPGSLLAGEVGSYTPPALERPQEARLISAEGANGPEQTGTPTVESTDTIPQAPSAGSSALPGSAPRKATDASNALIAVEQPTWQSAPTQSAGTPAENTATAASALPDVATLIARGDDLVRLSDVATARLFYGRAATLGSAPATTAMAKTYDPLFLAADGVSGVRPDARQAIAWYQRAMKVGDAAAGSYFIALVQRLQQTSEIDAPEAAALLQWREGRAAATLNVARRPQENDE